MRRPAHRSALATVLLLLLPLTVAAHVTTVDGAAHHGFLDGFLHPLTGLDHLLAMVAVGLWSARTAAAGDGRRYLAAPLAFAALLMVGALLAGYAAITPPGIEPMIAVSLMVLGLLTAVQRGLPVAWGMALVGVFAIFHGAAHGQELGAGPALGGMLLATLLLHVAGIFAGLALRRTSPLWTRVVGVALALTGGGLLIA